MNGFDKELHVATVATATIIINYANDVAGVWDRVLQDYRIFIICTVLLFIFILLGIRTQNECRSENVISEIKYC